MAASALSENVIKKLFKYIQAFNDEDLGKIAAQLDDEVEVYVEGKLAASGKHTILPSYERDFLEHKRVKVVRPPVVLLKDDHNNDLVQVSVGLRKQPDMITLDVIYTYRVHDMKQVRHHISKIHEAGGSA